MASDAFDKDFDDSAPLEEGEKGRPIVRHVVKDLNTAVKMRKVQAQADERARKAEASAAMAQTRAEERRRKDELRAEITKLRLRMTAREAASKHIAVFGPLYLMVLGAMCLGALGTGLIETEQVPVVSALLTLLVTMIGANLRSIVSEGNGHDDGEEGPEKTEAPKRRDY